MSSPTTVPIFDPDGNVRDIPSDLVSKAMAAGGRIAVPVRDKSTGSVHLIPHDLLGDALKGGGVLAGPDPLAPQSPEQYAASQGAPPLNAKVPVPAGLQPTKPTASGAISRFLTNAGEATGGQSRAGDYVEPFAHPSELKYLPDVLKGGLDAQGDLAYRAAREYGEGTASGAIKGFTHGVEYMLPFIGPTLAKAGDQLASGDIAGGAGTTTGVAAMLAGPKAMEAAPEATAAIGNTIHNAVVPTKVASSAIPPEAVGKLVQAVEPDLNAAPNFHEQFVKHLPDVVNRAAARGEPVTGPASLAQAFLKAGQENASLYREKIIGPVASEDIQAPPDFDGKLTDINNRRTTPANLQSRLDQINAELDPAYRRGGAGSQRSSSAVAAKDDGALRAEAGVIRSTLNDYLSQKYDVAPEEIAAIRERSGAQRAIGENIQGTVNEKLMAEAQTTNLPKEFSILPFGKKTFFIDAGANWLSKKVQNRGGGIAARAIRGVLSNVTPENLPDVGQPIQWSDIPKTPLWNGIASIRPELPAGSTPEEVSSNLARMESNRQARISARAAIQQAIDANNQRRITRQQDLRDK